LTNIKNSIMKNTLLFSAFSIFGLSAFAQPTIQSTDFYPTIGESFIVHQSDYVSPGPAGNNVTWDLSGLSSIGSITVNTLGPDASYPGSTHNLEYVGTSNLHVALNPSEFLINAEITPNAEVVYSDPHKMYQFPMTMGSAFTDNFSGTIDQQGLTMQRSGTVTVDVDGYGTLITPAGTFQNVLRVRNVKNVQDDFMGNVIETDIEMYTWIKAGTHIELANIQTISMMGQSMNAAMFSGNVLSLENQSLINPLTLYPNPALDIVTLQYDLEIDNVEVFDLNGRSIAVDFNAPSKSIDISNLNTGIYYVTVISNNSKSVQKLLKR